MSVNSLSLKSQFEKRTPLISDYASLNLCNLLIIKHIHNIHNINKERWGYLKKTTKTLRLRLQATTSNIKF